MHVRVKPKLATAIVALAGAGARRAGQTVAPYANMTTAGLGFMVGGAYTFGLTVGLIATGVACLLAEFNAGR